jgi:iron complex outermembrane recepter protein
MIAALCAATAMPALAQRTDDNAVTQADDAFGKSVGDENIGIYNPFEVRGFSPVDAGNVRIEGLYFDQQANPTQRLINGSTVHVGISAQGYPFPAPTGIADYELRRPGDKRLLSVGLQYGPFGGKQAEFDLQLPIAKGLGVTGGTGFYRETNPNYSTPEIESYGLLGNWQPAPGIEIIPFWSRIDIRDEESNSLIFTDGSFVPNRVPRDRFLGQKWADFASSLFNYGVVAKGGVAGFDINVGAFRSVFDSKEDHVDLLFGTARDGSVANRVVVVDGGNRFASTSGELRVSKAFIDGPRKHTLIASLRAREQDRRFGGAALVSLGASRIGVQDFRPEQNPAIGSKTRDAVSQKTLGLGYRGQWSKIGEISFGIQKTDYRKETTDPDPAVVFPVTRSKPWLFSANAALYATNTIAFYAGYTRGLEESPVAPFEAANRNEAPPAIRTEQKEAGIRWKVTPKLTAVIGYFDVTKPYFNLDAASRFRQLGAVQNRGIEFSIAGQLAEGLTLVAGNVYLDATVSGEEVDRGLIGKRPVATQKRQTTINLDYQLPMFKALSFNANMESTSDRVANAANTLVIPARSVFSLGTRYKAKIGESSALFRFTVNNIFNTFGYNVGGSGFFLPNGSRRYTLAVSADI